MARRTGLYPIERGAPDPRLTPIRTDGDSRFGDTPALDADAAGRLRDLARILDAVRVMDAVRAMGELDPSTLRDLGQWVERGPKGSPAAGTPFDWRSEFDPGLVPAGTAGRSAEDPLAAWHAAAGDETSGSRWEDGFGVNRGDLIRDPENPEGSPPFSRVSPGSRGDSFTRNYRPLRGDVRRHGWRDNVPPPLPSDNSDFAGPPPPPDPPPPLSGRTEDNALRQLWIAQQKLEVLGNDRVQGNPSRNPPVPDASNLLPPKPPGAPELQVGLGSTEPNKSVDPGAMGATTTFARFLMARFAAPRVAQGTRPPVYARPRPDDDGGVVTERLVVGGLNDEPDQDLDGRPLERRGGPFGPGGYPIPGRED